MLQVVRRERVRHALVHRHRFSFRPSLLEDGVTDGQPCRSFRVPKAISDRPQGSPAGLQADPRVNAPETREPLVATLAGRDEPKADDRGAKRHLIICGVRHRQQLAEDLLGSGQVPGDDLRRPKRRHVPDEH